MWFCTKYWKAAPGIIVTWRIHKTLNSKVKELAWVIPHLHETTSHSLGNLRTISFLAKFLCFTILLDWIPLIGPPQGVSEGIRPCYPIARIPRGHGGTCTSLVGNRIQPSLKMNLDPPMVWNRPDGILWLVEIYVWRYIDLRVWFEKIGRI